MNSDRWKIGRHGDELPATRVTMRIPEDDYDVDYARDVLEEMLQFVNAAASEENQGGNDDDDDRNLAT